MGLAAAFLKELFRHHSNAALDTVTELLPPALSAVVWRVSNSFPGHYFYPTEGQVTDTGDSPQQF